MDWNIPKDLQQSLKNKSNITVRFPPEPSGYLHIGHAKAIFFNYIIKQKYNGKMIVRMDDTNPLKESVEYEDAILNDMEYFLKIKPEFITHTSDYFDQIISYADLLINTNQAYVDLTDVATMRQQRNDAIISEYREQNVVINNELWNKMKNGQLTNGCVRIKLDMLNNNKSLRDPTIFRYVNSCHHKTQAKYKVYPTYDFACPIVDHIEKITHVFRNAEFFERDEQYDRILTLLALDKPEKYYYSKLKFANVEIGKRNIKKLIDDKIVSDWADPRLYTLRGLFKRGLSLDGLTDFLKLVCFSNKIVNMDTSTLWACNKKSIDKQSARYIIISNDNLTVNIKALTDITCIKPIPKMHRNPTLKTKNIYCTNNILVENSEIINLEKGEEFTLLNFCNVIKDGDKKPETKDVKPAKVAKESKPAKDSKPAKKDDKKKPAKK